MIARADLDTVTGEDDVDGKASGETLQPHRGTDRKLIERLKLLLRHLPPVLARERVRTRLPAPARVGAGPSTTAAFMRITRRCKRALIEMLAR